MQLSLQIFEYEKNNSIRTIDIDGITWFFALDVSTALGIKNSRDALVRLDDDERRTVGSADASVSASRTNPALINESGLYNLIFQSRKPEAKKFRKWVTNEVLPQIRETGSYSNSFHRLPSFVRRFNQNWNRVSPGYFSVISELFIRVYGRLEQIGYVMPDKGKKGSEIRPDISVGQLFSKELKSKYPNLISRRKTYSHILPEGREVEAYQYPLDMLPLFIEFVDGYWLKNRAFQYFKERDSKALSYLPKLLN